MKTQYIRLKTQGNTEIINITPDLEAIVQKETINDGVLFLNVIGSTGALTTMEYEAGLEKDVKTILDKLFPFRTDYSHNFTWSDDNGHSHLRSTFLKTNFFVTVTNGRLDLGTWQQVVFLDFDTRPRDRKIVVKILTDGD